MDRRPAVVASLLWIALGSFGCRMPVAAPTDAEHPSDQDSAVAQAVARFVDTLPARGVSGVVVVDRAGVTAVRHAFGEANRRRHTPNHPDLAFDIGSIAKTFTAAAVLRLVDRGALALDDTIGQYLQDVPSDKEHLTVRQLLTHSSGLATHHANRDLMRMDRGRAVRRALREPVVNRPGTAESYSNAGYAVLAALVEEIIGSSFTDFVQTEFLDPYELRHTGWYGDPTIASTRGYSGSRDRGVPSRYRLSWALIGGGGMVSTADDLCRWSRALLGGAILGRDLTEVMLRVGVERWASGWEVASGPHGRVVQKGGSGGLGFTSQVRHYSEHDLTIVVVLNSNAPPLDGNAHNVVGAELERIVWSSLSTAP